jgi:hypothetical protein
MVGLALNVATAGLKSTGMRTDPAAFCLPCFDGLVSLSDMDFGGGRGCANLATTGLARARVWVGGGVGSLGGAVWQGCVGRPGGTTAGW